MQIVPRIVTRPGEVAHGLLTGRRGTHVGQHPRPLQFRELLGIATVRLKAVARLAGDQGRRNDVAAPSAEMQLPVQGVAARPRFVATRNGPRRKTGAASACASRIRCQAATGSWTKSRQWETERTLFSSARATMCPPAKVNSVWPFNDACLRTSLEEARRQAARNVASILDSARELGIRDAHARAMGGRKEYALRTTRSRCVTRRPRLQCHRHLQRSSRNRSSAVDPLSRVFSLCRLEDALVARLWRTRRFRLSVA